MAAILVCNSVNIQVKHFASPLLTEYEGCDVKVL